jgi:hypothetical protein
LLLKKSMRMKTRQSVALLLVCTLSFSSYGKRPRQPKPGRAENARLVIGNLAKMIGEIGTIIEDPHDAESVSEAVIGIADKIIKLTLNAVQKKRITLTEAQEILGKLQQVCFDIDRSVGEMVMKKRSILI